MKTKKRHIALLLLVVLAIAGVIGAVFANSIVLSPANSVEFTQVESFGDPAFAKGLELNMMLRDGSSLCWDAKGSFGETGPEFETRHSYSQEMINARNRDSIYFHPDLLQITSIRKLVEEAAASEDTDGATVLKLDLSEYTEYLPLSIWAERRSGDLISSIFHDPKTRLDENNNWNKVLNSLNDAANSFLKLPVQKGMTVIIQVFAYSRSETDGVPDYNVVFDFQNWDEINSAAFGGSIVCSGPLIGNAYYVYMRPGIAGGQMSEGPGIYRIPLEDTPESEEIPMIQKADRVCAFDEGEVVFAGSMMQDPAGLAVITEKDGELKEYVSGGPDGTSVQALDLGTHPDPAEYESPDLSFMNVHFYKDYNVLHIPGKRWIVVQRAAGGSCQVYEFPESKKDVELGKGQGEYISAVFDGSRLAVAGCLSEQRPGNASARARFSGVRLSVYAEDGLRYYGAWSTSLKDDPFVHPTFSYGYIHDHLLYPPGYDDIYWIDLCWN